ncbi:hypothetical protein KCP78_23405 [Salmonella enterica subsp. enterica]|nr:hypothetical protein KCP78_23405 [Salmonella enterica subsp. enterica]
MTIINLTSRSAWPVCRGVFYRGILLKDRPRYRPGCAGRVSLYWPKSNKPRHTACATLGVTTNLCALSAGIPQALEIDVACDYAMLASNKPGAGILCATTYWR